VNASTIRCAEETLLDLFSKGKIPGTVHTCIGQENIAIAAMANIREGDIVLGNHRSHGHYLAYGGSLESLFQQIMYGHGSQHLHYNNFYTNGIQGGIVPNAAGAAFAEKLKGTDNISVVFLGDGTLGQGVVYETLNMAALWGIPVLFVVENNQYAMSTKTKDAIAGKIEDRFKAFEIACIHTSSYSEDFFEKINTSFSCVRRFKNPFAVIVDAYRLSPHSKGDDTRDKKEIEYYRQFDKVVVTDEDRQIVADALKKVKPDEQIKVPPVINPKNKMLLKTADVRVNRELNFALDELLLHDKNVVLMGEDIKDPYGGSFKVTAGLSTKYPGRVINTPISEAGITGIAVGMALQGMKPIVEIMFGDFLTLCSDQLVNHAVKYLEYGKKLHLVVRTPMGGRRGYGMTHSQSLEKMFCGIQGLLVVAPSIYHNCGELLKRSVEYGQPVLFIENKAMYGEKLLNIEKHTMQMFPTVYIGNYKPEVSLVTYGYCARLCVEAMEKLKESNINAEVIVSSLISHLDIQAHSDKIVTVEEGTARFSWGNELNPVLKITTNDIQIPAYNELDIMPSVEKIVEGVKKIV
jgi:2-oxoisovalerate dehydrogenase E1 component